MKVTADDIAQLLASAPPRLVPAHVVKAAKRGGASWASALFGLFFGAFGMIFVGIFFPWQFWNEWRLAGGAAQTVPGVITGVSPANMKVNGRSVMEYHFAYTVPGTRLTATCYSLNHGWSNGGAVRVRYLSSEPTVACIEGMRLSKAGWMGAWVIIFPVIGFGLTGWFMARRNRTGRLLREGVTGEVDVLSVEATNTRVNEQQLFKIVLSGDVLGAQPVTIRRLNAADIALAADRVEKKQPMFVLYDPRKPTRVLFPEALIDREG